MKIKGDFAVPPGHRVLLDKYDPEDTAGLKKNHKSQTLLEKGLQRLDEIQNVLYAEAQHALLIVLQALDAGGKDGTIRHVMRGLNPQGCRVTSFKVPTPEEAAHDFLWRIHQAIPKKGEIGVFNRSHYEDVLVVRVHNLAPRAVWSKRYEQINNFERHLTNCGVTILKFFLHISREEQKKRLEARLEDPTKRWKISPLDFQERKLWPEYQKAYEDALTRCSTPWAPWHIIPANKKWYRNLAVAHVIVKALEEMHLKYPKASMEIAKLKFK